MPYTADDLVAIERLIAGGIERIRFTDGREVQYGPIRDLMAIRSDIVLSLSVSSSRPAVRRIKIFTNKDF